MPRVKLSLKGASQEIEMGRIWFKKDLEKLELMDPNVISRTCAL